MMHNTEEHIQTLRMLTVVQGSAMHMDNWSMRQPETPSPQPLRVTAWQQDREPTFFIFNDWLYVLFFLNRARDKNECYCNREKLK